MKEYSQEELKNFFYHPMNDEEKEKIVSLGLNDIIVKLIKPTYQIKYIENVGYMFIGEGYLILEDGSEPTHYFVNIYEDKEEFKNAIKEKSNE